MSVKSPATTDGDNIKLAVFAIVFTVFAWSLGDAIIKRISADFPLWQIFVIRSAIATPLLVAVVRFRYPSLSLRPRELGWTAARSLMLTFMWVAYYAALPHLALTVAAAVYYTLPLFITLFAALFIGDKIGTTGWIAVALGFCGVLMIVRPQADDFNAYALLPLVSAILYALAMIITRTKCKREAPLILSLGMNVSFVGVGLVASLLTAALRSSSLDVANDPFLLGPWISLGATEWLAMGLLAAVLIIGSVGAAFAYQAGPSSIVATFDFSYLAFAAVWGFLFFTEVPDAITIGGMALIAAAGLLAVKR